MYHLDKLCSKPSNYQLLPSQKPKHEKQFMKKEIKTYEKIMLGIYVKVYQKDCILIHSYLNKNLLSLVRLPKK